jgi:hypothetical protein
MGIEFGISADDAKALKAELQKSGLSMEDRDLESSAAHLGFGWQDLQILFVSLVPLAALAAETLHVRELARVLSEFIATRKRKLRIKYERGGGFEIDTNASPEEIEPIIQRLLNDRATVWVVPSRDR